jgi:glycosyltransferase involved in cell wall biosynthesis
MKLLISAYACAPNYGSDHAVGWNWTTEAHRLGYEIWALVSPAHRDSIARACHDIPDLRGIHWVFPEVTAWPLKQAIEPKWERTYNLLWQFAAVRHARDLHRSVEFDAIHHLTWGGIRAPTYLGALKSPLIVGPIGGGEISPRSLRDGLRFRGKLLENIRYLSNSTITVNPLVRGGLTSAAVIFVHTTDTQNLFTGAFRSKTRVFTPLALSGLPDRRPPRTWRGPPKFLYAGRLLYWKGVHIALQAFAEVIKKISDARFTIVGDGPERSRLERDVRFYNLQHNVEFIPRLPQNELFRLYDNHDLLLFPSLHDAGGFVVLEAMSYGMPVVCLDLGGPKDLVTSNSGVVVKTCDQSTAQVAVVMAMEIMALCNSAEKFSELSAGAISRSEEFLLTKRVREFYDNVIEIIKGKQVNDDLKSRAV